ncbi:MAG: hypothetical protein NG747_01030 [Candidatus Brocadia sp.]|nr:hypothetical protein [Candidatus Brocadia sp.]
MATNAKKFIGKVLPDGHLSLPEDTAKEVGCVFEVVLTPIVKSDIHRYAESLAKEKGFSELTEEDIERIIHESRGIR